MRKEHTSHVVVISLMLLVILSVFGFVLFHHPSNAGARITTSLSSYPLSAGALEIQKTGNQDSVNTEIQILIAFLILLAFLAIVYIGVKVFKELRNHKNHSLHNN